MHVTNYADRFRFSTLQARFQTFIDLWDRGLRAREEGRPGPFSPRPAAAAPTPKEKGPEDRILHVAAFNDPLREMDKLHDLYDRLADARREVGEDAVPFHKFAELVKDQVQRLKQKGSPEVAFRVAREGREGELYRERSEGRSERKRMMRGNCAGVRSLPDASFGSVRL